MAITALYSRIAPGKIILRQPQIAQAAVQVFIHRINVVEAIQRGRGVGRFAKFFLQRGQLFQRGGLRPPIFSYAVRMAAAACLSPLARSASAINS